MKKILLTAVLLITAVFAVAQAMYPVVRFNVKDASDHKPIIGATIRIKGTSKGTITDYDGNATLNDLNKGDIFEVTYVGYETFTDTIGRGLSRAYLTYFIELKPDTQLID